MFVETEHRIKNHHKLGMVGIIIDAEIFMILIRPALCATVYHKSNTIISLDCVEAFDGIAQLLLF